MENWNYQNPANDPTAQADWNQTLVTKFNKIVAENNMEMRPVHIYAPIKFKSLFKTLVFYNDEELTIGDKYVVSYMNENNNIVNIGQEEMEIINY